MQFGTRLNMALIRYNGGPEDFLKSKFHAYHMLYPVFLPGGQTESLQGPRFYKVWQKTAAFTLGKQTENWEEKHFRSS